MGLAGSLDFREWNQEVTPIANSDAPRTKEASLDPAAHSVSMDTDDLSGLPDLISTLPVSLGSLNRSAQRLNEIHHFGRLASLEFTLELAFGVA